MKKKKIVIFSIVIVISFLVTSLLHNDNKTVLINDKENNYLINSNAITMMYETEIGSGEYQVSNDTNWPGEGYIFNERLSGCENGGTLSWNSETNKVIMMSNASDKCYVYFDKYLSVQITNVVASNITSSSITVNVSATSGTNQISKYYYSINNGSSYTESSNSNYTFTGLEKGTKYNIKVYAVDNEGHSSNIYTINIITDDILTLAEYIINDVYSVDWVNGLYYHDGLGNYDYASLEANDNSYRYSGANPNNYVCFGSDAVTCPDEYLYRIIGVFDEDSDGKYNVKLIKADYTTSDMLGTNGEYNDTYSESTRNYMGSMDVSLIASYRWNYDKTVSNWGSSNWTTSDLNKINLNVNYINYLGSTWSNKILVNTWFLGGMDDDSYSAKEFFYGERNNAGYGSNPTRYTAKVGLIYASDYGYATSPENWSVNLDTHNTNNNWMYLGLFEWAITPLTSISYTVFNIGYSDMMYDHLPYYPNAIRPVFYLNSDVSYISGIGTKTDPYRIS